METDSPAVPSSPVYLTTLPYVLEHVPFIPDLTCCCDQGIYPTCVLFAAAGGRTDSLLTAQVSQAMRFDGPPAAHGGVREVDTTIDFHLQDEDEIPVGALNDGLQNSHADNILGSSSIHDGGSRFASSEGIIEVERETIAT